MFRKNTIIRTLFDLCVLSACVYLFFELCKYKTINSQIYETKNDTTVIVEYDTLRIKEPVYIYKTTTDTMFVEIIQENVKKDTQNGKYYVKLNREQLHYSEKNKYDAWVSGFQPRLDSFVIYSKETTTSITKTLRNEKKWRYYTTLSYKNINNKQVVGAGLQVAGKKVLFGGEVFLLNNKVCYGFNFGLRINED